MRRLLFKRSFLTISISSIILVGLLETTFSYDEGINFTKETESFIEAYKAYKQDKNNTTEMNAMIRILPNIDWVIFFEKDMDLFFSFLKDYSDIIEKGNRKALGALLRARKGLDGAMAEGYAGLLGDAILSQPETMIRLLSDLSDADQREIMNHIIFDIGCKTEKWQNVVNIIRDLTFKNRVEETRTVILRKLVQCAE